MALTSVADQRAALTTVLASLSGITTVFPRKPQTLLAAELPAAVLSPQRAQYSRRSAQELARSRTWEVLVFVKKAESGAEFDAETAAEALIDTLIDGLAVTPRVILDDGTPCDVTISEDSSVLRMPFGADVYAGIVITLLVTDSAFYTPVSN